MASLRDSLDGLSPSFSSPFQAPFTSTSPVVTSPNKVKKIELNSPLLVSPKSKKESNLHKSLESVKRSVNDKWEEGGKKEEKIENGKQTSILETRKQFLKDVLRDESLRKPVMLRSLSMSNMDDIVNSSVVYDDDMDVESEEDSSHRELNDSFPEDQARQYMYYPPPPVHFAPPYPVYPHYQPHLAYGYAYQPIHMNGRPATYHPLLPGHSSYLHNNRPSMRTPTPSNEYSETPLRLDTNPRRGATKQYKPPQKQGRRDHYDNIDDTRSIMSYSSRLTSVDLGTPFQTPVYPQSSRTISDNRPSSSNYAKTNISKMNYVPNLGNKKVSSVISGAKVDTPKINNPNFKSNSSFMESLNIIDTINKTTKPYKKDFHVEDDAVVTDNPDIFSSKFFNEIDLNLFRIARNDSPKAQKLKTITQSPMLKPITPRETNSKIKPPSNIKELFETPLSPSFNKNVAAVISPVATPNKRKCVVTGCGLDQHLRGYCCLHYPIDDFEKKKLENHVFTGEASSKLTGTPKALSQNLHQNNYDSKLSKEGVVSKEHIIKRDESSNNRVPRAFSAAAERLKGQLHSKSKFDYKSRQNLEVSTPTLKNSASIGTLKNREAAAIKRPSSETPGSKSSIINKSGSSTPSSASAVKASSSEASAKFGLSTPSVVQSKINKISYANSNKPASYYVKEPPSLKDTTILKETVVSSIKESTGIVNESPSLGSTRTTSASTRVDSAVDAAKKDPKPWRKGMANAKKSIHSVVAPSQIREVEVIPSRDVSALDLDVEENRLRNSLARLEMRLKSIKTPSVVSNISALSSTQTEVDYSRDVRNNAYEDRRDSRYNVLEEYRDSRYNSHQEFRDARNNSHEYVVRDQEKAPMVIRDYSGSHSSNQTPQPINSIISSIPDYVTQNRPSIAQYVQPLPSQSVPQRHPQSLPLPIYNRIPKPTIQALKSILT